MKIRLHTLSPLHIGTGEELAPLDYVAYNNTFYRLTQKQFLDFIGEIPDGAKKFAGWVSEQYAAMKDIRDNRELSEMEGQMNAYSFCKDIGQEQQFVNFLNDKTNGVFRAPLIIDERTRQRSRGAKSIALGRVREAIKNGGNKPLVPGSSIKGALRTAVFYHYLTQYADSGRIERVVRDQLNERRARKERFALPLAHEAFFCAVEDQHSGRVKKDDEKMDLFKLVRISDGHVAGDGHALSLAKVNIYLVEKQMSRDRKQSFFIASQQPQASYCENIVPGSVIEAEIDFDIDFLLRLRPLIKDGAVPAGDFRQWIGIEEKVKQLFGL
ncbi:MAG: type III-A CRISPR-associated RAMP protein Csm5, partial [Phaeodactylibacter sp.]|nr:type III-A CRISPR-associated RAMP protein Csm5 [Phaeodactylibacter sp.]